MNFEVELDDDEGENGIPYVNEVILVVEAKGYTEANAFGERFKLALGYDNVYVRETD